MVNKIRPVFLCVLLILSLASPVFSTPAPLNFYELKVLAEQAGFPTSISPIIAAIGLAESSGNPNAHNEDRNTADNSYGLMQINMINFSQYQLGNFRLKQFGIEKNEALFDPLVNMKAAKKIYDTSGLTAWSAYRHGTYKKYLR